MSKVSYQFRTHCLIMSRQRKAFKDFVERVDNELEDSVYKLVLYGSVVRNQEREESDLDVFLVVDSKEDKDKIYDLASEVGLEHDLHVAPVVRTREEFNKTRNTFFTREVMESGEPAI